MADENKPAESKTLSRRNLEVVIRRAVELSSEESDSSDNVSEEELIRIAGELGISSRHVKQALFEAPREQAELTYLDRWFGPETVVVSRMVPCPQKIAHGRLEDYLVTHEYLQVRRRQGNHAYFEPADDPFSSIARSFNRPASRYHLARAQRAYLTIRTVDEQSCHVRLELSYAEKRKSQGNGAIIGGVVSGTLVGGVVGIATGIMVGGPGMVEVIAGSLAGIAAGGGTFAGIIAGFRSSYRKWVERTQVEADALLDRLEQSDTLQPPNSPWMRRLQQKLRGYGFPPGR